MTLANIRVNSSNKLRHFFVFVSLGILAAGATIFFIQAVRSINVQQDIQYPESAVVFGIANLWRGGSLYHDFHNPPFAVTSYPPVFYLVSAAVSKLFARWIHFVYDCARAVAFAATILTAIVAAFVTGKTKSSRAAQFGTSLLFLGSSLLLPWGFMARVDSLMLLFTISGLYLFIHFKESNLKYLAVVAFVLAIFTKQSALAAPAAVILTLLYQRRWRQGLFFVGSLVSLLAVCLLGGNYLTNGLMSLNIIGGVDAPMRCQSVVEVFLRSFSGLFLPLVLSSLTLIAFLRRRLNGDQLSESEAVILLFGLYLVGSLALAAFSSTKLGSDRNYYLDSLLAASVLGGCGIEWLAGQSRESWAKAILAVCLVIFVGFSDFINQKYMMMTSDYFVSEDNSSVVEHLRPLTGDLLSQDANIPLRLGKPVFVTDFYHLSVMTATGRWKPDPLISLIEQRHFQAVVLSFDIGSNQRPDWSQYQGLDIWDPSILNAINNNYVLGERIGNSYIYQKR